MKNNKGKKVLLVLTMFFASEVLIETTFVRVDASILATLGRVMVATARALFSTAKKAKNALDQMRYTDREFKVGVPVAIKDKQGSITHEFVVGLEYDFGFEGSGPIDRGFNPVIAMLSPPLTIKLTETGKPLKLGFTGMALIKLLKRNIKKYGLPKELSTLLTKAEPMMRLKRETVFIMKLFFLINAARNRTDPLKWKDVPRHLTFLFSRMARTVNEDSTAKVNGGTREPKRWKRKIYFKDTGIAVIFKRMPSIVRSIFGQIKLNVPEWELREYLERDKQYKAAEKAIRLAASAPVKKGEKAEKKVEPISKYSAMQKNYSTMRQLAGYMKKTVYCMEYILPLADTPLGFTDRELLVKSLRVHAAKRYQGILKVLKASISEGGDIQVVVEQTDEETGGEVREAASSGDLQEDLRQAKSMIKYRFPGLIKLFKTALEKLKAVNAKKDKKLKFANSQLKSIADIIKKLEAEQIQLIPIMKKIYGEPTSTEGLDELGFGDDVSAFDPEEAGEFGGSEFDGMDEGF